MNELLKVDFNTQTVSARELHRKLNIEKRFSAWFESNSQGFIERQDYTGVLSGTEVPNNGGFQYRELQDYNMSIDMAKHICLMSRSEEGMKCRQYFIDLEKAWNTPEQVIARALIAAQSIIEDKSRMIEEMKPKAEFFDAVADSKTAVSMNDVAKVLGIKGYGRNNLFEFLRNIKILDSYNRPYQKYVDCGWFRVIEQRYTKNGEGIVTFKTLVYQRGIDAIRRKIIEHQASA